VGRAIALLGVGNAPSGDRISTAHFTRDWQTPSRSAQKYIDEATIKKIPAENEAVIAG